jgi:transposase
MMDLESGVVSAAQEVEVLAKAERRRFTAEYKRKVLKEAEACTKPGELGALLRREGLYSSLLATWRAARRRGELAGLTSRKRGPKAKVRDSRDKRITELERENRRLKARAERAEALVEVQKKLSQLLGIDLPESDGKS